ncbi:MAG: replicative DNA helicase [Candidatus Omnitrophota bacterium]
MPENLEKIPPQNLEAERAVLGSMLMGEDAIAKSIEILDAASFYSDSNRKIYTSIINLYSKNHAVDLVTLIEELKRSGHLEEAGGPSYITNIVNSVPTSANVTHYAKIVKQKAILRHMINNATSIVTECFNPESNVDELVDRAEQLIFEISSRKVESNVSPIKEIVKDSIERIDYLYQKKKNVTGIPTGFADFDEKTSGLQNSDLIIIAGRPSMGKSAFATCIAENAGINEKIPVAFFSLEMSKEQLVQRMLCSHARVDAHKVRTGFLSQADWPRLTNAAGKLSEAPIFIDDTPALSILELRAKARRLKSQHDIKLVIVDYLQLMRGGVRAENRQQEISEISRSLKAIARELNVPVIGISQLSRAVEQRSDHRPQLSDLRESGSIEQDADIVALLLREEYYNATEDNKGVADIIIAKQRHGPVGTVKLLFVSEFTRFENLSKQKSEEIQFESDYSFE